LLFEEAVNLPVDTFSPKLILQNQNIECNASYDSFSPLLIKNNISLVRIRID